jgi:hypothetical protein
MERSSPQKLWDRFRRDIADISNDNRPVSSESFDDVLERLQDMAMELHPRFLRVIDQTALDHRLRALPKEDFDYTVHDIVERSGGVISDDEARMMVYESHSVIQPVDLLSFPHPEIRARIIGRFGVNSTTAGLRDLYDYERDKRVRGVIAQVLHARFSSKDLTAEERLEGVKFAEEMLNNGFFKGESLAAARASFYLLAEFDRARLPLVLQIPFERLGSADLSKQSDEAKLGYIRIVGERASSIALLRLVLLEKNPEILGEILKICEVRWGKGDLPLDAFFEQIPPESRWAVIAQVMLKRLGLAHLSGDSVRASLATPHTPPEPQWKELLKKLALLALDRTPFWDA